MTFRHDLAKHQFKQSGKTYDEVGKAATFIKNGKRRRLSASTVWLLCSGKEDPGDPTVTTVKALFKGLGLKPEYALNFQLKRSEFHLAVNGG